MLSKIAAIKQFGQRIWLDNISREFLASGDLQRLIQEDGIAGLTSNPAIFYKAISSDQRYTQQLNELLKTELSPLERYEQLAISDIKQACDILLELYQQSNADDGYVSLEVAPDLCYDVDGTIKNALLLWNAVNRPNLMIKVPATKEGVQAFEQLVILGLNVNITLLFSLAQVHAIWDAYLRGLTKRASQGLAIDKIKTVASFFLSRVDSALDDKLPAELQGKGALSLARRAYLDYLEIFNGERFAELKAKGAKAQYLLWASTGTKNKNYSDVLYIEELIGPDTVNTVPDATLNAFRDHGVAQSRLTNGIQQAQATLDKIEEQGINLGELGEKLQQEGLQSFSAAFNQLIELVK